jgi:hypothetical protein
MVHIQRHDIIGVMVEVIGNLLRFVFDWATSKEGLGVRFLIEDDAEASSHIDDLTIWVVVHILTGVLTSVSINVLELVHLIWWVLVNWGMVVWLCDGTDPWLYRQEFLGDCGLFDFFIKVEEIILWSIILSQFTGYDSF